MPERFKEGQPGKESQEALELEVEKLQKEAAEYLGSNFDKVAE